MAKTRHIPERRCVACGQRFPKRDLIRLVRALQGTVTVDPTGKRAGRGAYLCTNYNCWQRGLTRGNLNRSLAITLSAEDRDQILDFYHHNLAGSPVATQ